MTTDPPFDVRAHIDSRLDSEHHAADLVMQNLTKLLEERHRYFDMQIDGVRREVDIRVESSVALTAERRVYVNAELAAIRSLFTAAILAQKEAVQKAEEAQLRHNQQTNGYEQQLLEQYRNMLPRAEADVSIRALQDQIARLTGDLAETQTKQSNIQVQLATRDQSEDRGRSRFDSTIALLVGFGLVVTPLLVYFLTHVR